MAGSSLKGRGLFERVNPDNINDWLALGWEVRDQHWQRTESEGWQPNPDAPPAAHRAVTMWRDWTPQERAKMGEVRDASVRFALGYSAMQRDIALGRLFDNIANNPQWAQDTPPPSSSRGEDWVQVPDTVIEGTGGVRRYGKLAGMWVPREVLNHIEPHATPTSDIARAWRQALSLWKEGKTALNPVAHFNNIVGNISMAHFAGVSYWDISAYIGAVRDFKNNAPMLEEAQNAGLFTGSFSREELAQSLPPELQAIVQAGEAPWRKTARTAFNALTIWLRQPMAKAYEAEDSFFKYLLYRAARQNGMEPKEAADHALQYIFSYDDLPKGARTVRDWMVPFFAWTFKAVPAILHTAAVHPWRMLAPAAILHTINWIGYAMAASGEDEGWWETMETEWRTGRGRELAKEDAKILPEYMRGMGALLNPKHIRLGNDEAGRAVFLDASRLIPGGDILDFENQMGGLPLPAPIMPSDPRWTTLLAIIGNRDAFTGREIVDDNDTPEEAARKRTQWAVNLLLPAVAAGGYHSQRMLNAIAHASGSTIETPLGDFTGIDRQGQAQTMGRAIAHTGGIKLRALDMDMQRQKTTAQKQRQAREIRAELRSVQRQYKTGHVSRRQFEAKREEARAKLKRLGESETE